MTGILNLLMGVGGALKDQYFNLVSLLLPGDGTNGAQNNTFLDSSSNNFTITRNGDTTQGTFSPFSQTGWGAYFDGSNDYVSVANNSALDLSTADFCIGFWVYLTAGGTFRRVLQWQNGNASNTNYGYAIHIESSNQVSLRCWSGTTGYVITNNTSALQISAWNWVCVTRSGTSGNVYVNGTGVSGTTPTTINNPTSSLLYISGDLGSSDPLLGYLSGLQIVKGSTTALSTTAPTSPYTAVSGTSLLTFQYNRFRDASSNTLTVTPNNGAAITPFSPFAPTSSYSAAAVGGSGYFDGGLDYLSFASGSQIIPATGDFTVEAFVYPSSTTVGVIISQANSTGSSGRTQFSIDAANIKFQIGSTTVTSTSGTVVANQWNYIAMTRTGSSVALYINGSSTTGLTVSGTVDSGTSTCDVGRNWGGEVITGYIANLRVSTSIRSGLTTVPTALLSNDANTRLLLNFTNAGVVDATAKNVLETESTAQISSSITPKWGSTSIKFNGSSDYLRLAPQNLLNFGTGDFTIEAWVYTTDNTTLQAIFTTAADTVSTNNDWGVLLDIGSSGAGIFRGSFYSGTTSYTASSASSVVSNNTWTHVAFVRESGNIAVYYGTSGTGNRSSTTSANVAPNFSSSWTPKIGYAQSASTRFFNGYIQYLRISNRARYTGSTYTVPTAPFPVQ